jgi:hypothetical protein
MSITMIEPTQVAVRTNVRTQENGGRLDVTARSNSDNVPTLPSAFHSSKSSFVAVRIFIAGRAADGCVMAFHGVEWPRSTYL